MKQIAALWTFGVWAVRAGAGAAALAAAGCGGPPAPPSPTVARLTLRAGADANAAADGRGAPTILRVYQLASTAAFETAEFYRLLNGDAAALGPDLVKRDEYLLAPGAVKEATLTVPERVQALGVFAAPRRFQDRVWRVTVALAPNRTTAVAVALGAGGLSVGAPGAGAPGAGEPGAGVGGPVAKPGP